MPPSLPALVDAAPCGFLSFTDDGQIVLANEMLLEVLGFERGEVVGQPIETLMALPTRIFYQTHFFPLVTLHGRADEIYLALRAKDGTSVSVLVNAVRRDDGGGPVTHAVLFPVARRQQYEGELLRARRDAEAALADKDALARELTEAVRRLEVAQDRLVQEEKLAGLGRMAAGVAHEVRNPLNFVINFALLTEELLDDLRTRLATVPESWRPDHRSASAALVDDLTRNAGRVVEHAQRVEAIVRRMKARTASSPAPDLHPIGVNALAEACVTRALTALPEGLRDELRRVDLQVVHDYAPAAGAVGGAPAELGLALETLLANAFEAAAERARSAPDDGVRPQVSVRTRRTSATVDIEVSDNGPGVPASARDRVFEPFFTTKGSAGGHSGLGLSLAYEIVREHGGVLTLSDGAEGSATFTISLPPHEPPAPRQEGVGHQVESGR